MVKYSDVLGAIQGLKKIATLEISVKDAVRISRLLKSIEDELKIYNKQKKEICERYGELDDEKGVYNFREDTREAAIEKFCELDDTDVDFGDVIRIKATENIKLDAVTVLETEKFIEFDFGEGDVNGN